MPEDFGVSRGLSPWYAMLRSCGPGLFLRPLSAVAARVSLYFPTFGFFSRWGYRGYDLLANLLMPIGSSVQSCTSLFFSPVRPCFGGAKTSSTMMVSVRVSLLSYQTLWANFQDICQLMKRQPEHVFTFVVAELGTEGSIDGNQRLVLRGKFVIFGWIGPAIVDRDMLQAYCTQVRIKMHCRQFLSEGRSRGVTSRCHRVAVIAVRVAQVLAFVILFVGAIVSAAVFCGIISPVQHDILVVLWRVTPILSHFAR